MSRDGTEADTPVGRKLFWNINLLKFSICMKQVVQNILVSVADGAQVTRSLGHQEWQGAALRKINYKHCNAPIQQFGEG